MSQAALDVIAFAGAVVAVVVDGRRSVVVAALAVSLGLAPAAAEYAGGWAPVILLGAALAAAAAAWLAVHAAVWLGHRGPAAPAEPAHRRKEALFGPRTVRLTAAAVALPAVSWVSFNVPVGSVVVVEGRLFPVALVFTYGVARLLLARNPADLATGVAITALSITVAWLLRGGSNPLPAAIGVSALVPLAAAVEAWLRGRQGDRRWPSRT